MDRLDEMKQQMELLRGKLDKQEIVSENLIRRVVKQKVHSIQREAAVKGIISLLCVPYCYWTLCAVGISSAFTAVTVVFIIVALFYTWYAHRGLRAKEVVSASLCEVARRTAQLRLLYARWLRFSIPFLFLWMSWFVWEIFRTVDNESQRMGMLCGAAIGLVVGGGVGIYSYRRTQRKAREIIEQIKDLDPDLGQKEDFLHE